MKKLNFNRIHGSPLVSIVTPSYNSFPYIQETIESVRRQYYSNIEHIIIDGGSKDGTVEFLQQQSDLLWVSERDNGQSHALNKGFQQVKGEIIGWLNADDTYQADAVNKAVNFLLAHPDIDLVYSDLQIIDERSQCVGLTKSQKYEFKELLFTNFIKQPTVFMRRKIIQELKGVNETLHYTMDRELWFRIGLAGFKMYYLEGERLANFRLIPGTKSFEQTPLFRKEWINVLEVASKSSSGMNMSPTIWQKAINKTRSQYHMALAIKAIESNDRKRQAHNLYDALRYDPSLIKNQGTWFFIASGFLGIGVDRLRKFKKNLLAEKTT